MAWNYPMIVETETRHVEERLGTATREELLAEVIALRTVLHPLLTTLASLDDKAPRGVNVTSKLFPASLGEGDQEDKLAVYDPATRDFRYLPCVSRDLHLHAYEEAESLTLENGTDGSTRLDDEVSVFAVHSHWTGAYAFGGEITMADVRRGVEAMWPGKVSPAP